jgi:hypothetical protein
MGFYQNLDFMAFRELLLQNHDIHKGPTLWHLERIFTGFQQKAGPNFPLQA